MPIPAKRNLQRQSPNPLAKDSFMYRIHKGRVRVTMEGVLEHKLHKLRLKPAEQYHLRSLPLHMIRYLFQLFVRLVIIITLSKVKLRLKLPQFLKQQLLHADSSYYCGCSEGRAIQRETIGSSCSSFTNHPIPLQSILHSAIILLTASPVYN